MTNPNEGTQTRIRIVNPHEKIVIPGSKSLVTRRDLFTDRIHITRATDIPLPDNWDDIPAIHRTRGANVEMSEDLVFVVELPLYKACRMLYNAGIVSTESNAHFDPGQEETVIGLGIKWDSLNDAQKNVAEKLCTEEPDKWKHISAEQHGDSYEALYLSWKIQKNEVTPRQVKEYIDSKVEKLIAGRIRIRIHRSHDD